MRRDIHLGIFSSSWQITIPYVPASLAIYANQSQAVLDTYRFRDYIFHTYDCSVRDYVSAMDDPFLVGMSIFHWNQNRTHKFLRLTKERFPSCITMIGGGNAPYPCPDDFFIRYPYIDVVVHKEGEIPFRTLLETLSDQPTLRDFSDIPGMSFNWNGETRSNGRLEFLPKIIDYPSPITNGYLNRSLDEADRLGVVRGGVWETNRGCPYSCTFCDWGGLVSAKLRVFSDERLHAEIPHLVEDYDEIFFGDANFGIAHRDPDLAERIVQHWESIPNPRLHTIHAGSAKNSNDRVLAIGKTLARAQLNRSGVSLSLQTYTDEALKNVKRANIDKGNFIRLQERFIREGVPSYTDLIMNLPGETPDSFLDTLEFVLSSDVQDIRSFQLELYENSEIMKDVDRFKIVTETAKILTGTEPDEDEYTLKVAGTYSMSPKELIQLRKVCRFIDYAHLGKWLYYISWYMKRQHQVGFKQFYLDLFAWAQNNPTSIPGKAISHWFIDTYNSGEHHRWVGPVTPFGVEWDHTFRREQFVWTCIAMHEDEFYQNIMAFIGQTYGEDNWQEKVDVIEYNSKMMLNPSYDPFYPEPHRFVYDWPNFFRGNELREVSTTIVFKDLHIGRRSDRIDIIPHDSTYIKWAAGARSYFVQRQGSYVHDINIAEVTTA